MKYVYTRKDSSHFFFFSGSKGTTTCEINQRHKNLSMNGCFIGHRPAASFVPVGTTVLYLLFNVILEFVPKKKKEESLPVAVDQTTVDHFCMP